MANITVLIDAKVVDKGQEIVYYSIGGELCLTPHYNQNYTRVEIDAVLSRIKSCVEKGLW